MTCCRSLGPSHGASSPLLVGGGCWTASLRARTYSHVCDHGTAAARRSVKLWHTQGTSSRDATKMSLLHQLIQCCRGGHLCPGPGVRACQCPPGVVCVCPVVQLSGECNLCSNKHVLSILCRLSENVAHDVVRRRMNVGSSTASCERNILHSGGARRGSRLPVDAFLNKDSKPEAAHRSHCHQ